MAEKQAALAHQILQHCRSVLYGEFPFLDGAFASLPPQMDETLATADTDGVRLYASPEFWIRAFAAHPAAVRRGYLHLLLHCLYLHLFERRRDPRLWNLACDMAVERVLEPVESLRLPENAVRSACFSWMGGDALSAEQLYERLRAEPLPAPLESMETAFRFDDHRLWRSQAAGERGVREQWERLLLYAGRNRQGGLRQAGTKAGTGAELVTPGESAYDYRRFLRRFMMAREERKLDLESFDYIYYNLGMERYGDMPLVEPLEYQEVNRLEEMVIAIDTSGSCSAETVTRFLSETFGILREKKNFFQTMKVYLIQCDCVIQNVTVLRCEEDWRACAKQIRIQGRGGTDFTPVFRYVEQLRAKKELRDLKALLYFTDGDGVYPRSRPDYETAFVFVEETPGMAMAPVWAHRLLVRGGTTG